LTEIVPPRLPRLLDAFYPQTAPYYNQMWDSWWVSSDAGVRQVLTDSRLSAAHGAPVEQSRGRTPFVAGMQASNDRRHDDLRRAVAPRLRVGFTRFTSIRDVATRLIDRIVERGSGRVDLVEEYARPFAAQVMCVVMGLRHETAPGVWRWLDEQVNTATPTDPMPLWERQWAPWFALLVERRTKPHGGFDGLIDYLLKLQAGGCRVDGRRMSDEDIAKCCTTLTAFGAATVAGGIATTVAYLNQHDRIDALHADPRLVSGAAWEALRCEPPLLTVRRRARTDVEVEGQRIRAGQWVTGCLLAANRDPDRFPDGDDLTWGLGEYRCPGEEFAEAEMRIGVGQLIRWLPGLKVDPAVTLRRRWPALVPELVALPCFFDADAAIGISQRLA
jgi:cytochrome P450